MRYWWRFLPVLLVLFQHQAAVLAQSTMHWEPSIESAKQVAARSNRLVLVVFSAPSWCMACRALENDMLTQPGAVGAIETNYVPVKINVDFFPDLAKQYGIKQLPTSLVLAPTPQGEVLEAIQGRPAITQYLGQLNQVATDRKRRHAAVYAQIPPAPMPPPTAAAEPPAMPPPATYAPVSPPPQAMAAAPAMNAAPAGVAATPPRPVARGAMQPPPGYPPFGLDGYCPVQLVENSKWTKGDRKWGAVHRGRTYLFLGSEERRRFMADPDRYAPVASGDDVVAAVEQGRAVPGRRAYGVQFAGHVYLFADGVSMEKFQSHPHDYAERALQALRSGTPLAAQTR